jgi:hypothetical protein
MKLNQEKIEKHVAMIRKGADVFLIDTAQLKRRTGEEYVEGEAKPIYADPEEIRCRLITRSGSESNNIAAQAREIQQVNFTGLYRMQIPYELDVNEGDQILYNDAVTGNIKTMDVIFAPAKHRYSAAVIIQLQEVK